MAKNNFIFRLFIATIIRKLRVFILRIKKYDISYNEKLKNHISIIKETIKPNDSKFYKNVEI